MVLSVPLSASSAGMWLKSLVEGVAGPPSKDLGTHSLKATLLSWCSKHGLDVVVRRALGYHTSSADRSVFTYSRDALSGPLHELQTVIDQVANSTFRPDATRSGYFVDEDGREKRLPQEELLAETSSESSADEDEPDFDEEEAAIEEVVGEWQGNKATPWMSLAAVYFRHSTSRCIHVLRDESGAEFSCGRKITSAYLRLSAKPKFLHPTCATCERNVSR